jgi:predicted  nucleic acid-binding Zn-ribbon protein
MDEAKFWPRSFFFPVLALLVSLVGLSPSLAHASVFDGQYTLRVYRVWNDSHAPNRSNPVYYPGKTEILYTARFDIAASEVEVRRITDHTNSNARAMHDFQVSLRQNDALRISGSINTLIGVVSPGSFSVDFVLSDGRPAITAARERGLSPSYMLKVDLTRIAGSSSRQTTPSPSTSPSASSSAVDQVRLAQTILAAMGLYTSSIDGVAGPGTNRALTAGMWQLNSTEAPTVENFLRVAVGRIRTVDQPVAAPSNAAELTELRTQNANLTSQLESSRAEAEAAADELLETKNALATLLVETRAGNADGSTEQAEIAALEAQLAELAAAHEAEVSELTAALEQARAEVRSNDAANATIADLREELERLRPLTAQLGTLTEQNTSLQRQLSAANETVADLRDGIASDERVSELQRQLDAANATVASLRDEMTAAYVPVADYVALQRQISALNANNTEMRDRIEADYVLRTEYAALEVSSREAQDSLRSQMAAANQTVAELRERMNTAYVPVADHVELQRQLAAASATATELRETMRSDYVSKSDFSEAQRILAATNESMADLRRSIETEYMPLEDYVRLERQVSALNSTILELQDRNEVQRNRMVESEALFRNFREDCAAVPECARAMRLD